MRDEKKKRIENVSIAGCPGKRYDIEAENGLWKKIREAGAGEGSRWIAPGLIDMHLHMGWTDFDHGEQEKRSLSEIHDRMNHSLKLLLSQGITAFRDGGGLLPGDFSKITQQEAFLPTAFLCGGMLEGSDERVLAQADGAFSERTPWIKLFATGGIGAQTDQVLKPCISEKIFYELVLRAHKAEKKVMVHTWGGETLDWSIKAQVDSVEHCVFMNRAQAEELASRQIPYTVTAAVYRLIAGEENVIGVTEDFRERAKRACEAHAQAVRYGLSAGVPFLFGTDFYSDPALVELELEELFALQDYGLTARQVWEGGTLLAARALGEEKRGAVAEGFGADGVIYDRNPLEAQNAAELKRAIREVWKDGQIVYRQN